MRKALTGLGLIYLVGMLISLGIQAQYIGTETTGPFHILMNVDWSRFNDPVGAITGFFVVLAGLVQAVIDIISWNYSFFTGSYAIFRYAGWTFSIAMIVMFVLAFRGSSGSD